MESDRSTVETKLAAARARLILDKPFLGALVLRLPLEAAKPDWCPTTATDARAFYYNPDYIRSLSLDQTQFMLAHEALHCALSHFARRQHRVKHRWDLACDYAINPLLVGDGLTPPPSMQVKTRFEGLAAEEIYPLLDDQDDEAQTLDRHLYDRDDQRGDTESGRSKADPQPQGDPADQPTTGDGSSDQPQRPDPRDQGTGSAEPPPLSRDERETLSLQWQQRLAGAAQQAMQAGKLSGQMARLIDQLLQPQLPWRMLLARYLSAAARDDYSYGRPSRREGDYILPSLHSRQLELVVAVDTSGSVKDAELDEFIGEIDAIKGQVRARVTLLPCDADIAEGAPFHFEPWEEFRRPDRITGGGGTSFLPVFDWVTREDTRPDLLIYFTDAKGEFPTREPDYPVIWLVKGRAEVPWGQRIQLN